MTIQSPLISTNTSRNRKRKHLERIVRRARHECVAVRTKIRAIRQMSNDVVLTERRWVTPTVNGEPLQMVGGDSQHPRARREANVCVRHRGDSDRLAQMILHERVQSRNHAREEKGYRHHVAEVVLSKQSVRGAAEERGGAVRRRRHGHTQSRNRVVAHTVFGGDLPGANVEETHASVGASAVQTRSHRQVLQTVDPHNAHGRSVQQCLARRQVPQRQRRGRIERRGSEAAHRRREGDVHHGGSALHGHLAQNVARGHVEDAQAAALHSIEQQLRGGGARGVAPVER